MGGDGFLPNRQDLIGPDVAETLEDPRGPADFHQFRDVRAAQPQVNPGVVAGKVTGRPLDLTVELPAPGPNPKPSPQPIPIALDSHQPDQ